MRDPLRCERGIRSLGTGRAWRSPLRRSRERIKSTLGLPGGRRPLMAMHTPDDERQWAVEKRDFVADRRDQLAAEREAAEDTRDVTADARESALDERERQLDARAAELGLP